MGLRYRKSIKVCPGVKVNLTNKNAGVTIGGKHARVSYNTNGRKTQSISLGHGISYVNSENINSNVKGANNSDYVSDVTYQREPVLRKKSVALLLCITLGFLGGHKFYEKKVGMGLLYLFTFGLFGVGVIIDFFVLLTKSSKYIV